MTNPRPAGDRFDRARRPTLNEARAGVRLLAADFLRKQLEELDNQGSEYAIPGFPDLDRVGVKRVKKALEADLKSLETAARRAEGKTHA